MDAKQYVEVRYVELNLQIDLEDGVGGPRIQQRGAASGSTRMWLATLPQWLAEHPGTLVVAIKPV